MTYNVQGRTYLGHLGHLGHLGDLGYLGHLGWSPPVVITNLSKVDLGPDLGQNLAYLCRKVRLSKVSKVSKVYSPQTNLGSP
jgi:hypothetical protein